MTNRKTWHYSHIKRIVYFILSLLLLQGCSKKDDVKTILSLAPGFQVTVPETYKLDESQNPNNEVTSTWFRDDGLSLFSIDRQPLAGARLESLQKRGNKRYLNSVAGDLERDLGARLEVFRHFQKEFVSLGGKDAVVVSFSTRHEGTDYKSFILVTVQLGEPANEIMLDLRVPSAEPEAEATWEGIVKSWNWGEAAEGEKKAEGGGEKKEAKSNEHH